MFNNIAIIGVAGAIGNALLENLARSNPSATIHAFSRKPAKTTFPGVFYNHIDYNLEKSIEESASIASKSCPIDLVIITTGILHDKGLMPEKSLRELSAEKFRRVFEINTILPALIAKSFLPKLNKDNRSIFAVLSARVGSISDNKLGGWYSYRASKSALNMIIKNSSIEIARSNTHAVIVGIHPGTVDSNLSKPFQNNVPNGKLFTPDFSAKKIIEVIQKLTPKQSGKCFAWDGQEIIP
ncbi:MAG: SDR family NAD(P)-dependent oxidoreductase [Legionellaceae bacterium]|nr:SDR family NAD(P)-dependent oxidoreductase [Legionellaceae bacterium]